MKLLSQSGQWKVGVGGLLQGFSQGLQSAQARKQQREEMEHRKKELDLRLKLFDMQAEEHQRKLKKALTEEGALEQLAQQVGGETVTPTEGPATEQGVGPAPVVTPSDDPQKRLKAALVRAGEVKQALTPSLQEMISQFQQFSGGGAPGTPGAPEFDISLTPQGPRLTPKREAVGLQSVLGQIGLKIAKGTASPEEVQFYNQQTGGQGGSIVGSQAKERVLGEASGKLEPKALQATTRQAEARTAGEPVPASTGQQLGALETLLSNTVPNIRQNLKESFLGPVKGTETALAFRRRFGSATGTALEPGETTFRQALKDAGDQLLRARSGAQINEQEYARLTNLLPQATDEPKVFREGLDRFERELRVTLEKKKKFAVTPRGRLGESEQPTLPPPPAGWR